MLDALGYGMIRALTRALNTLLNDHKYHPIVAKELIEELEGYRSDVHIKEMVRTILCNYGVGSQKGRSLAIDAWARSLSTPFLPGIEKEVDLIIVDLLDEAEQK